MEFESLGRTGEKVPKIGLGTWKMGTYPEEELKAIRKAVEVGMRLIDTAEMYANESLVGEAIRGYARDSFFLETKVSPSHLKRDDLIRACKGSLKRLGLKTIDLYMVHWPNPKVDIAETMAAMEYLADKGMIRHIGVSNFDAEELEAAVHAMKRHEIVSNQVEYSILVRGIEGDGTMSYCRKNKITVIAYSPLARGAIFAANQAALVKELQKSAAGHGKTPAQVALNWIIAHKGVIAIPKASQPSHVVENAGASGWRLSPGEIGRIDDSAVMVDALARRTKPAMGTVMPLVSLYTKMNEIKNRRIKRIIKRGNKRTGS
jgi:diketogulonate reductase-like aldo/keto reductase